MSALLPVCSLSTCLLACLPVSVCLSFNSLPHYMYVCLAAYLLSVSLPPCLSTHLYLPSCLSASLSTCFFVCSSVLCWHAPLSLPHYMYVCLPAHLLSVSLPSCLSTCLYFLSVCQSVYMFVYLPFCLMPACLTLSLCLPVCLSACLSVCLPVFCQPASLRGCLPACQPLCLSVCLSLPSDSLSLLRLCHISHYKLQHR